MTITYVFPDILKKCSGPVRCVEWAPDGSKLVSGGGYGDNKIKLWSPSTGECLNTLEGHRYLRWFMLLRRQNR